MQRMFHISVAITKEMLEYKEAEDCQWRELIGLGIKYRSGQPEISKRLFELEHATEKLQKANAILQNKILELDGEITSLRQNQTMQHE